MNEPTIKQFNLSKDEIKHFGHLDYMVSYLKLSRDQFISAIITERLGEKPTPDKNISWKLEGDKLVLEITDHESFYRPDNSE